MFVPANSVVILNGAMLNSEQDYPYSLPNYYHTGILFPHTLRSLIFASQMTLLAFILGTLIVFVVYRIYGQRQGRHLPPGPRKLPFIGNLLSMPRRLEWETFAKWGQEHSS